MCRGEGGLIVLVMMWQVVFVVMNGVEGEVVVIVIVIVIVVIIAMMSTRGN
jgi:hypothetical protein